MNQIEKIIRKRGITYWFLMFILWGLTGICAYLIYADLPPFLLFIVWMAGIFLFHFLVLQTTDLIFNQWRTAMWIAVFIVTLLSFFLLHYQNIFNWKWAAGENNGETIALSNGKSWDTNHPVIKMYPENHSENGDINLPWRVSFDFSNDSITTLFSRKISFFITQPRSDLFSQDSQNQFLHPQSGDGVIISFKYFVDGKWYLAQELHCDAINDPGQRRWYGAAINLPPNASKLSIEVFPEGASYNGSIWVGPNKIKYSLPVNSKLFLYIPLVLAWSLLCSLVVAWVQKNIERKRNLSAVYSKGNFLVAIAILIGFFSSFTFLHNFSNYWRWPLGLRALSLFSWTNVCFAVYYSSAIYWQANYFPFSRKKIILISSISFLSALFIAFVIPLNASKQFVFLWSPFVYLVYLMEIITIWSLIITIGEYFSRNNPPVVLSVQNKGLNWILLALPSLVICTIWLLTFWPGIMNGDTYSQWLGIVSGKLNDWIPPLVIIFGWLITRFWYTPGAIAFAQILAVSAVFGWGLAVLTKYGLPRWIAVISAFLLPLLPANSTSVILIGKDLPYSASFLALTVILLEILASDGKWIESVKTMVLLIAVASLVSLFRHNGLVASVGSVLVAAFLFKKYRKNFLAVTCSTIAIVLLVNGPVYDLLGVRKGTQPGFPILIHNYEAHIFAKTPLLDDEKSFLNNIRPLSQNWKYNPYDVEMFTPPYYNFAYLVDHPKDAIKVFVSLSLRDIPTTMKHMLTSSSLVWRITSPEESCPVYASLKGAENEPWCNYSYIPDDPDKIVAYEPAAPDVYPRTSFIPFLRLPLYRWVKGWQNPEYVWITWRPAIYLYLLIFGGIVFALRNNNLKIVIVLMPALLHSLFMLPSTLAQHFRYQYPVYLVGLYLISWLFLSRDINLKRPYQEKGT